MVAATLESSVWQRANRRCEYCQLPADDHPGPFQIDHIIAEKHGGETAAENLALSCWHCNVHKGPNIAGLDPETRALTPLFHPRRDRWNEHFTWDGPRLTALSAIGRTTIAVLRINDPLSIALRESLLAEGRIRPS